jgi:CRP-like cAMP-binding protein
LPCVEEAQKYFTENGIFKYKYIITLGPGKMFGELGLLMKKPRAATILA